MAKLVIMSSQGPVTKLPVASNLITRLSLNKAADELSSDALTLTVCVPMFVTVILSTEEVCPGYKVPKSMEVGAAEIATMSGTLAVKPTELVGSKS